MGRIEDALRKLELERRQPPAKRAPARSATPQPRGRPLEPFASLDSAANSVELDAAALSRWGPVAMLGDDSHAKREYGQIKRPVISQALESTSDHASNIVLIASAGPGEGKSLTALNLALSLAREKDLSVLLVDADLAKPDLSQVMGLRRSRGLSDLLADDQLQIADVIWKTSIGRLYFMPAGTQRDGPAELFGSQRMQDVADMLSRNLPRTITVIDSAPLLLTNESRVLASLAGQVLLVTRANQTPRLLVTEAIGYLDPEKTVGLILNGTSMPEVGYYSGVYSGDREESGEPVIQSGSTESG